MKRFGIFVTIVMSVLIVLDIAISIRAFYQYEKNYESYWNLADKSSTITKKAEYIDKFVSTLEVSDLFGKYNAVLYTTPDNLFDNNFEALKSLQQRLHEIEKMDITSFEYQTAIQQITAQEQGEAHAMLRVFQGIWFKENYFMLWDWIALVQIFATVILLVVGIMIWVNEY